MSLEITNNEVEVKIKKVLKWVPHSEHVKKYFTNYYKTSETIQCECYGNYKKVNKHKHLSSKQHKQYLARTSIAHQESIAVVSQNL